MITKYKAEPYNRMYSIPAVLVVLLLAFFPGSRVDAQTSGPLYTEIAGKDSLQFAAFNSRDIDHLEQYFDPGLEFYQDNTGVRNYEQTIAAFTELFKKDYVLTRRLVPGSVSVYPIKDYGAIETGRHIFSHVENGHLEEATYYFMQIWQKKDGAWHVTREVSYGH